MKIIVDVPVEDPVVAQLRASGRHCFEVLTPPAESARVLPAELIADADVLFCAVPPANHAEMRSLQWVQLASTGYTQLFGLDLPARGVIATNCRGCFDVPIAEWNVAMMVNLARNFRQMIRNQEAAVWDRAAIFQREIRGLTLGLWGYGGIGRETARLARALGLRVHVLTRNGVGPREEAYTVAGTGDPDGVLPDRVFRKGDEMTFLGGLDFLIVAMPLTKQTEGLIGERELQALPRHAFLLNPARGPIVREEALLRALREGWIAGAAIDTHYRYPTLPDHPLWGFPNVIFSPHISGSSLSPHFKRRLWEIFAQNLARFDQGRPLLNVITPAQLAGE
ncbi:D-2-hydroxyacid dehydrogenase [Opitutus sp. GAS368]|uniref:D-2-hydroxyacid dehydrogenase n=1 Tax=Opitutus sp. GAS368 TaxID=1882749 RepID=UPI00087CACC9|nr:D-2-hydroxyacid dehydrogenase [Opitutus sp. GAS368]SDS48103.1 Phosphoglycerate dehydrogenase [Opitutus sp. GAS368]